jgi:hypothetical protein
LGAPYLDGIRDAAGLARFDPTEALRAHVGWQGMAEVDRLAPQHWTSPLGRKLAIDYGGDTPEIAVRLQEVLGTTRHPTVGPDRLPIRMVLLSPAKPPDPGHDDLPGFWAGSYADVRKDMRAQYPKTPLARGPDHRRPDPARQSRAGLTPFLWSEISRAPHGAGAAPPQKRNDAQRHRRITPVWFRGKDMPRWRGRRPRAGVDALGGVACPPCGHAGRRTISRPAPCPAGRGRGIGDVARPPEMRQRQARGLGLRQHPVSAMFDRGRAGV